MRFLGHPRRGLGWSSKRDLRDAGWNAKRSFVTSGIELRTETTTLVPARRLHTPPQLISCWILVDPLPTPMARVPYHTSRRRLIPNYPEQGDPLAQSHTLS
jgi:hypothetical protein